MIPAGAPYKYVVGKWDDEVEAFGLHHECSALYQSIYSEEDCIGFSEMREAIQEATGPRGAPWWWGHDGGPPPRFAKLEPAPNLEDRRALAAIIRKYRRAV